MPTNVEDAHIADPFDLFKRVLCQGRQFLQLVDVGADNLDRIVPLDSRHGFHDVVADVLGEIPHDTGQFPLQVRIHLDYHFRLRPRPLVPEEGEVASPAGRVAYLSRFWILRHLDPGEPPLPAGLVDHGRPFLLPAASARNIRCCRSRGVGAVVGPAQLGNDLVHFGVAGHDLARFRETCT